jgi:hypothetical protein
VKLILLQDGKESVKVYDDYYGKNALVQLQNGVLRISSFEKQTLAVVVHVNNLNAVEAFDTSSIKTLGKLQLLNLDVTLHNNASADLTANTVSLFSSVTDQASLKLCGTTDTHTILLGDLATLAMNGFSAQESAVTAVPSKIAAVPVLNTFDLADIVVIRK